MRKKYTCKKRIFERSYLRRHEGMLWVKKDCEGGKGEAGDRKVLMTNSEREIA